MDAMFGLAGILNGVGSATGISDFGRGADQMGGGSYASGLFHLAMAIPFGGSEARAGLGLAERVVFKTAHAARHLPAGLTVEAVEEAIRSDIIGRAAGNHFGWIQVGEQWLQYRAKEIAPGLYNVGTYFPVSGVFRRR